MDSSRGTTPINQEDKGTRRFKRWVYWAKRKPLTHDESKTYHDTFVDSRGTQYVTLRTNTTTIRRLDLLRVPGANRREKLSLLRAIRAKERAEKLAAREEEKLAA